MLCLYIWPIIFNRFISYFTDHNLFLNKTFNVGSKIFFLLLSKCTIYFDYIAFFCQRPQINTKKHAIPHFRMQSSCLCVVPLADYSVTSMITIRCLQKRVKEPLNTILSFSHIRINADRALLLHFMCANKNINGMQVVKLCFCRGCYVAYWK